MIGYKAFGLTIISDTEIAQLQPRCADLTACKEQRIEVIQEKLENTMKWSFASMGNKINHLETTVWKGMCKQSETELITYICLSVILMNPLNTVA